MTRKWRQIPHQDGELVGVRSRHIESHSLSLLPPRSYVPCTPLWLRASPWCGSNGVHLISGALHFPCPLERSRVIDTLHHLGARDGVFLFLQPLVTNALRTVSVPQLGRETIQQVYKFQDPNHVNLPQVLIYLRSTLGRYVRFFCQLSEDGVLRNRLQPVRRKSRTMRDFFWIRVSLESPG